MSEPIENDSVEAEAAAEGDGEMGGSGGHTDADDADDAADSEPAAEPAE